VTRGLVIFVALAVVAVATTNAALSGANFTSQSTTMISASTSQVASDTLQLNAGDNQTATVGTAVATAPSVLVTDASNNPVSGVSVTFAVASGGGSVTGASATTDGSGIASVGSWTLGTTAGANTLLASSPGLSGSPVTFTATGTAGTAAMFVVTASDYNPNPNGRVTISAQLADRYGNALATSGISVSFTSAGGGSLSGPNPVPTNGSGVATISLRVTSTHGAVYTVTASSGGLTGASPYITTR
jgi:adhesin/invasin